MKQLYVLRQLLLACVLMLTGGVSSAYAQEVEIWKEDWSSGSKDQTPSQVNGNYSQTDGGSTTKLYAENRAGGTSPELLISKTKGGKSGSWTVSNIDLQGNTGDFTLSYNSNKTTTAVTVDGKAVTMSSAGTMFYSGTFSVPIGTTSISIVFKNTSSSDNLRIDNVKLTYNKAATPGANTITFNPAAGDYKAAQKVTISASTDGSTIYYTTDGSTPDKSSNVYKDGVMVTKSGTTIKALAVADGKADVSSSATYTIKPDQPVFSSESKTFTDPFTVTLSLPASTPATSKIHYTIGETATDASPVYDGTPIEITGTTSGEKVILHAVVVDEYGNVGTEKYCTYTFSNDIVFDFTANPNIWGIAPGGNSVSNTDGKRINTKGVILTTASGTGNTKTCIYTTPNLRIYSGGGSITLTAPAGYNLYKIVFNGDVNFSGISGSTWNGNNKSAKFTASGTNKINTITVTLTPLYKEDLPVVAGDVKDGYYSTFSNTDRDVVIPSAAADVYAVSVDGDKLKMNAFTSGTYPTTSDVDRTGYYIPKNTGVLVYTHTNDPVSYYFASESNAVTIPENNLKAVPTNDKIVAEPGYKYYKLAYGNYTTKTDLGFYWGAAEGGAFTSKKGLAYLAVPAGTSGAAPTMFVFGGDDASGIVDVQAAKADRNDVIYNLAGQRVQKAVRGAIYIVNGKKVILK